MTQIIITITAVGVFRVDAAQRWKNLKTGERWVYSVCMLTAYVVLMLASFDVDVPSPIWPIDWVVRHLFHI